MSEVQRRASVYTVLGVFLALWLAACGTTTHHTATSKSTNYYLALGDSLALGYQTGHIPTDRKCTHPAADATGSRGYVCRVYDGLRRSQPSLSVENLSLAAEPGEDSCSFRAVRSCYGINKRRDVSHGDSPPYPFKQQSQLKAALTFLRGHGSRVRYITLDLGGNDFDPLITQALQGQVTQAALQLPVTQARFRSNYGKAIRTLHLAAPHARLVLIDQYDPLSGVTANLLGSDGGTILRLATQALSTFASTVKQVAAQNHATFVDVRPAFAGHAVSLTWIASGENIHPNTTGYRKYANAVLKGIRALPE